ncbi:MAG: hypothetical protein HZB43_11200 [candidate division Zixibacteria bacterium]|nr:hypothetical protein [candidate division Zixibacteria bacterium]
MNVDRFCEQESTVLRAARSNTWDEATRHHAASCPICQESLRVSRALGTIAGQMSVPSTPDPRLIWLKASFAQRQKRSAFIARIAMVAYSILGVAFSMGIYWIARTTDLVPSAPLTTFHLSGNSLIPMLVLGFVSVALLFIFAPIYRHTSS